MSGHYSVSLAGPAPWGFRLQGGKDFNMPLTISRLTDGGKAAKASIAVGDLVLSIDGIATEGMNHLEAQNKIKACAGNLELSLQKASSVPKVTEVVKDLPPEIIKPVPITQLPPPAAPAPASTGPSPAYNKTARPFGVRSGGAPPTAPKVASIPSASSAFTPAAPAHPPPPQPPFPLASSSSSPSPSSSSASSSSPGRVTAPPSVPPAVPAVPQPSVYNTPIQLYSNENACEVAMGQRRGLLENQGGAVQQNGVPRRPIVETDIHFYHVPSHGDASKKRLMEDTEDWHPRTGTSQSRSFRILAQITGTGDGQPEGLDSEGGKKQPQTVSGQVRRPEGAVSPSLLDALLISPVFRAPPLRLRKKKRRTKSALHLQKMKSVSWHQSVTDLSDPALSSPVSAVYILSDLTEEPSSPAVKTMTKAPTGGLRNTNSAPATTYKPPTALGAVFPKPGAQIGHVAPAFGSVTNSSAKVPVPAPDRPAPRPHPKDEDSLVQRAEHMPAGTRTPMCGHCNMAIRGPFLVAMGKSWHPEEFTCAHCHGSLADVGFVEERGAVYCEHCYEEFFAPTCGRCQHKILGEVINALKQTWHMSCFLCVSCQKPIGNSTFHLEDGEPYCERDYYTLFGTSCRGCDFPIEAGDKFLEALGATWHDTCFVCTVCCASLEGQAFFSKNGKPLCKKHAHTVKI
ncbi:PDZ and LIM domain protein 5-like isoform X4 [Anguilla anguilla]|uniref:PDZ and LIM domain protein 5-like isoform X4 n=1 Tax=Anguilla anguilla TaxID=7936 RepID=UPI0015ADA726|nr:PDZ and LIM domain protein 5-like isoform X4 [Anguilla anguilla]